MHEGNRLAAARSPYLLQHAHNPVHWQPWDRTALDAARTLQRPILLSIGYAACHWCHVMAHESFEDPETAALMNRLFLNIKVDREERPDIDQLYMTALHALGEQGGWPLTMFLTPDAEPFWGGTYFPPEPRWGRPSFRQILTAVAGAWVSQDPSILRARDGLRRAVTHSFGVTPGDLPTPALLASVTDAFLRLQDTLNGGLRGAPKFPNPPIFRFLWQESCRTGDPAPAEAVHRLLHALCHGGIADHLGGGFARYATDEEWLVPHFEKMLYDNAQLLELLALAHGARPSPLYADHADALVGWLTRDMAADGAFAASEDADSEGEEGRFYVWTQAEIDETLGADAPLFRTAYDVTAEGNWEGHTILRRVTPRADADTEARLTRARATLLDRRATRPRPARDDKILADWNALTVAALARASASFDRPAWLALAETTFDAVLRHLGRPDGRVDHAWRDGVTTAAGLLEDQAAMARAALALHEATGDPTRIAQAIAFAEAALHWFAAEDGSLYQSASDATDLPGIRPRSAADGPTPSGAGLLAETLARLHHLTGDPAWRRHTETLLRAFTGRPQTVAGMPTLLAAAALLEDATTLAITPGAGADTLLAAARRLPDPLAVILPPAATERLDPAHPAAAPASAGGPAQIRICHAGTCGLPTDRLPPVTRAADLHPSPPLA